MMDPEYVKVIEYCIEKRLALSYLPDSKDALTSARDAFRALVERSRWRKQSEEPAPKHECVLEVDSDGTKYAEFGRNVCADSVWLPWPELPEAP